MTAVRLVGLLVGLVIVASLLGGGQLVRIPALLMFLVTVLLVAVRGSRPIVGGSRHSARGLPYFARYAFNLEALPEILIGAFAGLAIVAYVLPDATPQQAVASYVVVFALYLSSGLLANVVLGIGGVVTTLLALLKNDGCTPPLSRQDTMLLTGLVLLVAGVYLAAHLGFFGFARRLAFRMTWDAKVLAVFGVLEALLFVVRPNGLVIWEGAPPLARPGAVVLIVAIAILGSFAPGFMVLVLLAVAVALGQAVLLAVELDLLAAQPATPSLTQPCRDPIADTFWMLGFVGVASVATSLRGGRS